MGVVHLLALRGSPRSGRPEQVLSAALFDAEALVAGGLDGFVVENFGDAPFFGDQVPPSTIAEMTALVERLRGAVGADVIVGVNVLRNDARAALAIAAATGADFIRVNVHSGVMHTDQGTLAGRAAETMRERRQLGADVDVVADVGVKHALPPSGFELRQAAKDTAYRGLAAALIVTGTGTGSAADERDLRAVKAAVPDRPLLVGSGVTADSAGAAGALSDGVIVGTWVKRGGNVSAPVDAERVKRLVAAARGGVKTAG